MGYAGEWERTSQVRFNGVARIGSIGAAWKDGGVTIK